MELSPLFALFALVSQWILALAAALVVLTKLAEHAQWLAPFCNRLIRLLSRFLPWRRLAEKIHELQVRVELVADKLALTTLTVEMSASVKAIVVTDAQGLLRSASVGYLNLVDHTLNDVQGTGWLNTVHQEDRNDLVYAWQRAVQTHCDFDYDYRIWLPNSHKVLWVSVHARHARNYLNGRIAGWVAELKPMKNPPGWAGDWRLEQERPHYKLGHKPDFDSCPEQRPLNTTDLQTDPQDQSYPEPS